MGEKTPKILVAVDRSSRSMATARYVAGTIKPGAAQIVAYSVLDVMPQSYWDLHNDPAFAHRLKGVKAWALDREVEMNNFMDKVLAAFARAGHPQQMLTAKVASRKVGVAADLAAEAAGDYDTVVFGRRGVGAVRGILMGSVALKLINALPNKPLWVVGKNAKPPKVLITLDGSANSLRAVDYVAQLCAVQSLDITLVHVLREQNLVYPEQYNRHNAALRLLQKGARRLEEAGIAPEQVRHQITEGVSSRAAAIVDMARQGKFGTIVMGRKGLTDNSAYSLGRVTQKVLGASRGLAVWIIP